MITNTNLTIIQGNLVRDAEYNEGIGLLTFSIAVDYAGNEKDSDSNTGYFDVKMWLKESDYVATTVVKSVKGSLNDGRLVKGAKIALTGRLSQERWPKEGGGTNARVVIIAESMNVLWSNDSKVPVGAPAAAAEPEFSISQF